MTTTVTSASNIREKFGIVIRDLLAADSTFTTLVGGATADKIRYGYVNTKTRTQSRYPFVEIDMLPSDLNDWSQDGELQNSLIRVKITAFDFNSMTAKKIADRAFNVITGASSTLLGQGFSYTNSYSSSLTEESPEGKILANEGLSMNFNYVGSRS